MTDVAPPRRPVDAADRTATVRIHDLDARGRGAGRVGGKTTFVHGALPGEEVVCRRVGRRRRFDEAVVQDVVEPSPDRVEPKCRFHERCGGCSLQHLSGPAQLRHKERTLLAALATAGAVSPRQVMPPLVGSPWRYRRKARLGARYVAGRYGALVGFRERVPGRVADITDCEVLADPLGPLVMPLRELVGSLDARARVPQVEVAAGDDATVLVIRHLDPLAARDLAAIETFAARHGIGVWLQPGGADSARAFADAPQELHYSLDDDPLDGPHDGPHDGPRDGPLADGAVRLAFSPLDFVQVNAEVNRALVRQVVRMLAPAPGETVLDAYCGIGNFSLPLAARGAAVTGLEAGQAMVERARSNAADNALSAAFHRADLTDADTVRDWLRRGWDKLLIDPPRSGAGLVVEHVGLARPSRIVYVSCNPDTLARDAARLVHGHGYRLSRTGLVDMFPHTSHVESVTEFEAGDRGGPGPESSGSSGSSGLSGSSESSESSESSGSSGSSESSEASGSSEPPEPPGSSGASGTVAP